MRILNDAKADKAKSLGGYLDEMLTDSERNEKDEDQFFALFDRQVGPMTMQ